MSDTCDCGSSLPCDPIATMANAEWNILDSSGCRIAICGYDDDHERSGPPIANELVAIVNEAKAAAEQNDKAMLALANLRMLCVRIARADDFVKRFELACHAVRIAEEAGVYGPSVTRVGE